jgi:2'-5' RNA ligase
MEHDISIRVTFPKEITGVLRQEKQRFITDYGSEYKSEPHITLYLDSYTADGYPKLLEALRGLRMKPFTISLLTPEIRIKHDRHHNLYVMDVSNKTTLSKLREAIIKIADPYRSPFIREKTRERLKREGIQTDGTRKSLGAYHLPEETFDPHITLGEIDFDKPQEDITETQKNLRSVEGKEIIVSGVTVFWYGKEDGAEKASLLEEITIPFNQS